MQEVHTAKAEEPKKREDVDFLIVIPKSLMKDLEDQLAKANSRLSP